jgi:hypothetical protein
MQNKTKDEYPNRRLPNGSKNGAKMVKLKM